MTETEERFTGRNRLIGLALLVIVLGSLAWTTLDVYDARNDASLYWIVARNFWAGDGMTYLGDPFLIRPPGFTALLAPVLGISGEDVLVMNRFVTGFGVLVVMLAYLWLLPLAGGPLAAGAALALWFAPGTVELSNQLMSDVPGVAFLLMVLLYERRVRERGAAAHLGLGLAIGVAALVRTMNVLLVPAILGARVIDALFHKDRGPRLKAMALPLGAVALGAALLVTPWSMHSSQHANPERTDQTHIHSYSVAQWHADKADPGSPKVPLGEVLGRSSERLPEALTSLGSRMKTSEEDSIALGLGAVAVLLCLAVFLKRRQPAELFVLGALCVVGTYFAFKPRLVYPLLAVSFGALAQALYLVTAKFDRREPIRIALAVLLVVASLLTFEGPPSESIESRDGMRRMATDALEKRTPEGAVLAAATGWDLGIYLPKHTVVSLRFAFKHEGPAGMERVLREREVEYIALFRGWQEDQAMIRALRASNQFVPFGEAGGWLLLQRR